MTGLLRYNQRRQQRREENSLIRPSQIISLDENVCSEYSANTDGLKFQLGSSLWKILVLGLAVPFPT